MKSTTVAHPDAIHLGGKTTMMYVIGLINTSRHAFWSMDLLGNDMIMFFTSVIVARLNDAS